MLDSNKSYRRKNKVGKQVRKSKGWDGLVDVYCSWIASEGLTDKMTLP